ncbi:MAG TPA: ATP-binding protein, partial [Bryobacteraceae bacterium]|nr:ATP-binding protein [Bryobacteraceae bacterium]
MERIAGPLNQTAIDLFSGPGEMARLMRETDWEATPLGHPDLWPLSLRVAVRMVLGSGYPMYIAWGPQFIQIYNDAYRPILGKLKHPAALGSGSPQTFPELWEFIGPMFMRVLEQGQDTTLLGQALFLNRNGYLEECYYDFSYSPIPADDLGKVGGVFVTCTEVTTPILEQRRLKTVRDLGSSDPHAYTAEDVCRTAAEVLGQNALDIPFAAIYLVNEGGQSVRLAAASGATPGDPVCPPAMPISDEAAWPVRSTVENSSLQHVQNLESRFSRVPTGAWPDPPQEAVLIPFTPASPQPLGFLLMGVNPRKQFDGAMEQFLVRCAHAIGGRLANARTYEDARRRAEALAELDRAKTVFFSNISHEFRTPLTLIASPLEDLAASVSLNPGDREMVELAQRNVIRLQRLVNNLLDFSRIEAGRVNAAFEPVDLAALTAELASGFRSTFEKAGLSLVVEAEPLSEPVYIDREMWEKIALNLLSNAFKFTFEGSVTVALAENADSVEIHVADTGVGIPETELPRVFERFYRIEGTRRRSYEGTGIGLALVQELIRIHGGTIAVTSQEGVGTRFTIRLRKGSAHLDAERIRQESTYSAVSARVDGFVMEARRWIEPPAADDFALPLELQQAPPARQADPWDKDRRRVLVVDDNTDMRQYLRRLLEPFFETDIATQGGEALHRIYSSRPDLVLMDAMMPVMDGYTLLSRIRATPEIAGLPVIMVSARAGTEMEIEGREAGADDYVTKPFSGRELVARVRSVLKIAEVRAASEAAVRASESRSREILERTTDAVFVLDRDWRFSYLNTNAVAMIANRRDLTGKNVWQEFPDAVGTEFWRQYHRVMDERVIVEFN